LYAQLAPRTSQSTIAKTGAIGDHTRSFTAPTGNTVTNEPIPVTWTEERYFYIVSYPRSGNTWLVNSLKDYLGAQRAVIGTSGYGGKRLLRVNDAMTINLAGELQDNLPIGVKTHETYPEFAKAKRPRNKVVQIVRDPRDSMISFYFFTVGWTQKDSERANNFDAAHFQEFLETNLPKLIFHIESWQSADIDRHTVKYEELQGDYTGSLQKIRDFTGLPEQLSLAEVKRRNVDDFREIDGFKDVLRGNNMDFYRKGIVGDWKNYFTEGHSDYFNGQAQRLLTTLGYTPA
jgi:hypothetical protein